MPRPFADLASGTLGDARCARVTVPEIAERLGIGRLAVYAMLERRIIPGVRLGRRWIVTRHAYEQWEQTCGTRQALDLGRRPEVSVLT